MNEKRKNGWLKHLDFMLVDLVCLEIAYLVAYASRHPDLFMFKGTTLYNHLNIVMLGIDICYVLLFSAYKNILKRSILREIQKVLIQDIVIWVMLIAYLYVTKQAFWFSRTMFVCAAVLSLIFMLSGRLIWKNIIRKRVWKGKTQSYMLLVTSDEQAKKIIPRFKSRIYNGFNLNGIAILNVDMEGESIEGVPVVSNHDHLLEYIRTQIVDEVMICLPGKTEENKELVDTLLTMGVVVHLGLDYDEDDFPYSTVERIGGFTFLTTSINTVGSVPMVIKRITDIAAGLLGCVITGIAFLIVAPLIYKASPGPIFYTQERMGKNGRRFKIYKFRSMYMDADKRKAELMAQNKMSGNMFKMDNDPRIIGSEKGPGKGIGNIIRALSIDELPQFYNILKGDMSLVGTRPPTVDEFNAYELHHKIRLSMKPGLTGMWQVSGRSEITDFEEIVRLDASYIENWSLKLDVKIILKTFQVVFERKGAE